MTKGPGQMRGPVIVFNENTVVLGYNKDRLEELAQQLKNVQNYEDFYAYEMH